MWLLILKTGVIGGCPCTGTLVYKIWEICNFTSSQIGFNTLDLPFQTFSGVCQSLWKVTHPPNKDRPDLILPFLLPCDSSWIINLICISFVVPSSSLNEDRSNSVENPIITKCCPLERKGRVYYLYQYYHYQCQYCQNQFQYCQYQCQYCQYPTPFSPFNRDIR